MRLPGWLVIASIGCAAGAAAEPKATEIDSKPFRDRLMLFHDAQGGTYAVLRDADARVFYGSGKELHEQLVQGGSTNGDAWEIDMWTPRLANMHRGAIRRLEDGTFQRWCDGLDDAGLTPVSADKAKTLIASVKLLPAYERSAYLLARDDAGVYYYVDHIRGAQGYRVFVGKKGAMKQLPLTDIALDSAGAVFSTKTGDLRLVQSNDDGKARVKWVHGEKGDELHFLDLDVNSPLIFKDLGIYGFMGTICDNV